MTEQTPQDPPLDDVAGDPQEELTRRLVEDVRRLEESN